MSYYYTKEIRCSYWIWHMYNIIHHSMYQTIAYRVLSCIVSWYYTEESWWFYLDLRWSVKLITSYHHLASYMMYCVLYHIIHHFVWLKNNEILHIRLKYIFLAKQTYITFYTKVSSFFTWTEDTYYLHTYRNTIQNITLFVALQFREGFSAS